ncbi:hypothetical protein [uncultured Algoriphagus sp.]
MRILDLNDLQKRSNVLNIPFDYKNLINTGHPVIGLARSER